MWQQYILLVSAIVMGNGITLVALLIAIKWNLSREKNESRTDSTEGPRSHRATE
jgi:hypothetical protein